MRTTNTISKVLKVMHRTDNVETRRLLFTSVLANRVSANDKAAILKAECVGRSKVGKDRINVF